MTRPEAEDDDLKSPPFAVSAFSDSLHHLIAREALSAPLQPGAAGRFERYEILRVLGQGAMGTVLLARDPARPGFVALKVLRANLVSNPVARRRFLAEAGHMRRLAHPGIVQVLELGEHQGVPWFAMPFWEHGSLASTLAKGLPLDRERILAVARTVANALVHAHRHGIIHRDLNPANILLEPDGTACVADFGLARAVAHDEFLDPEHGHCEGTAPFMSPAVARGEAEDTRCDIYSFGAVLYQMLTGRPPYRGETPDAILRQVQSGPPPPIRTLNPRADFQLAFLAETAMARELRDRYAHMADVAADLERIATGRPPLGARAFRWGPMLRRLAGNRRLIASAVSLALVSFLVWGWSASRPRLELHRTIALPQVHAWQHAIPAWWDHDRVPDFIIPEDKGFRVVSGQGQQIRQTPVSILHPHTSTTVITSWAVDINSDGYDDVFVSWAEGDTSVLAAINNLNFTLKRFTTPSTRYVDPMYGPDWTRLYPHVLVDFDGRGQPALLVTATGSRGREPRALICYDVATESVRWRQTIAPFISTVMVVDLDGDGRKEVLCGTYAVSNINLLSDGTDDLHSYVYAFCADGSLLWRFEGGGEWTTSLPLVHRPPSGPAVVYVHTHASGFQDQAEVGRITRLDPSGTLVAQWESPRCLLDCTLADLTGDGQPGLLATDLRGHLLQLDAHLNLRRDVRLLSEQYDGSFLYIAGVTNLTRSPALQIVVAGSRHENPRKILGLDPTEATSPIDHDVTLFVLDARLRLQVRHQVAARRYQQGSRFVRLLDLDENGISEVVDLGGDTVDIFKYRSGWPFAR